MKSKSNTSKPETTIEQTALIAALNTLLEGEWEFPDSCVEGIFTRRVANLEMQVKSLANMLGALAAQVRGEAAPQACRIDVLAAKEEKPAKAKK